MAPSASTANAIASSASPAAQIAPALISLAKTPDGTQRLTLRLQPPELGQVDIRIDRPTDGPTHVDITVQRSETLTLLLRDQPQLQRALDQAGVPVDNRNLNFHVAPPSPATPASVVQLTANNGAAAGDGGQHPRGNPASPEQSAGDTTDESPPSATPPMQRWLRAGLDITA